jgi:hypothetical protein
MKPIPFAGYLCLCIALIASAVSVSTTSLPSVVGITISSDGAISSRTSSRRVISSLMFCFNGLTSMVSSGSDARVVRLSRAPV